MARHPLDTRMVGHEKKSAFFLVEKNVLSLPEIGTPSGF
jgi:hypothetical protein